MRKTRLTWFLISIILGIFFLLWGILTPSRPLFPGTVWLVLPGSIMLFMGLFGLIEDIIIDSKEKKKVIESETDVAAK